MTKDKFTSDVVDTLEAIYERGFAAGKKETATWLDKIRAELHATAEMHEDGDYYLREEWIDEIFEKYKGESEAQDADSD